MLGLMLDLVGNKFGKLTAVRRAHNAPGGHVMWLCRCACSVCVVVSASNLRSGKQVSCGCQRRESARRRCTTHGMSSRPEYRIWLAMIQRCTNPKVINYKYYGGLGVKVCMRWRSSFVAFYEDMGKRPTSRHSIDRIDPCGDYRASNCRWATPKQQRSNQRKP